MKNPDLLAIDVALLPPPGLKRRVIAANRRLWKNDPSGFFFDKTHVPHLTLLQQYVRKEDLPGIAAELEKVFYKTECLNLTVTGSGRPSTTVHWVVQPVPELKALHKRVFHALAPWARSGGGPAAFFNPEGLARASDADWVRFYRSRSSLGRFYPHITLGVGEPEPLKHPIPFTIRRAALCLLGRFCACRKLIKDWRLKMSYP